MINLDSNLLINYNFFVNDRDYFKYQ